MGKKCGQGTLQLSPYLPRPRPPLAAPHYATFYDYLSSHSPWAPAEGGAGDKRGPIQSETTLCMSSAARAGAVRSARVRGLHGRL